MLLLCLLPPSPSFVSQSGVGKAPSIRQCMGEYPRGILKRDNHSNLSLTFFLSSLARLIEIKSKILEHNNALYRASANASPRDMNVAMTGISQEVSSPPPSPLPPPPSPLPRNQSSTTPPPPVLSDSAAAAHNAIRPTSRVHRVPN